MNTFAQNVAAAPLQVARRAAAYARAFGDGVKFSTTGVGFPDILLYFGLAPGDDLMCTAVIRELKLRGRGPIWFVSNFPELFSGRTDVDRVLLGGADVPHFMTSVRRYRRFAKLWQIDFRHLEYAAVDRERDWSEIPTRHVIAELCARAGVTGPVSLRPYLDLTSEERSEGAWAKGRIVIQSSGMAARFPIRNKQWFPERFQAVVDQLRNDFEFVQLGSTSDPALENVTDLRGKTTIRQTAGILHNARLYIGIAGFPMHLARAVECPGVIVYGGREAPWQTGYSCNINLYTALSCSPCWRWNTCDIGHKCMTDISADHVVQAVRELVERPRDSLAVDTYDIA